MTRTSAAQERAVGGEGGQLAAKPAADQLRKEADSKAAGIVSEANRRADSLVAAARRQAGQK